jgi:glycosyltransferase involved in cell wall biosynthesis
MAQRPHYFYQQMRSVHHADVTWVEPMPSRYPRWQDLLVRHESPSARDCFDVQFSIATPNIPVEPLADWLTDLVTTSLRKRLRALGPFDWVVLGKPSRLGLILFRELKNQNPNARLLWDCMDDMPAFHQGRAAARMREQEHALWREADVVWTSSRSLYKRAKAQGVRALWVPNGLRADAYHPDTFRRPVRNKGQTGMVLGYVGSIAPWMDWNALVDLATLRPESEIRLTGPLHCAVPAQLPKNIRLYPPVAHEDVPALLAEFDWGLIPFLQNPLTDAVDPIKYYEYRAAGLPVLSTPFGDMRLRGQSDGVWMWQEAFAHPTLLQEKAEAGCPTPPGWVSEQDWSTRFERAWQQTHAFFSGAYNPSA